MLSWVVLGMCPVYDTLPKRLADLPRRQRGRENTSRKWNKPESTCCYQAALEILCDFHHKVKKFAPHTFSYCVFYVRFKWRQCVVVDYTLKEAEIPQEKSFFNSITGRDRDVVIKTNILMRVLLLAQREEKNPHRIRKSFQYLLGSRGCQIQTEIEVLNCNLTENLVLILNQI